MKGKKIINFFKLFKFNNLVYDWDKMNRESFFYKRLDDYFEQRITSIDFPYTIPSIQYSREEDPTKKITQSRNILLQILRIWTLYMYIFYRLNRLPKKLHLTPTAMNSWVSEKYSHEQHYRIDITLRILFRVNSVKEKTYSSLNKEKLHTMVQRTTEQH